MVRIHPVTGERALFVNPGFTAKIVGVSPDESRAILDLFFAELTKDTYAVRFHWEPGSVAFWDNRVTAHRGPQDIDHLDVERVLHRVTLIGEVPVGPNGLRLRAHRGQALRAASRRRLTRSRRAGAVRPPPARRGGQSMRSGIDTGSTSSLSRTVVVPSRPVKGKGAA